MGSATAAADVRRRLHNDDWGYETNCFVCEQRNEAGLRIPFFHDTEADIVDAVFELGDAHSGAPTLVHGGLQLAILDEAMAWAAIAVAGKWALTSSSSARFLGPVQVDVEHRVVAEVVSSGDDEISTVARILDADGRALTTASASFVPIAEAVAVRLVDEVHDEHRGFLSGE